MKTTKYYTSGEPGASPSSLVWRHVVETVADGVVEHADMWRDDEWVRASRDDFFALIRDVVMPSPDMFAVELTEAEALARTSGK